MLAPIRLLIKPIFSVNLLQKIANSFKGGLAAPIHINFRFREPLAPVEASYDYDYLQESVDQWYSDYDKTDRAEKLPLSGMTTPELVKRISGKKRGLIVAGPDAPFRIYSHIGQLSQKLK